MVVYDERTGEVVINDPPSRPPNTGRGAGNTLTRGRLVRAKRGGGFEVCEPLGSDEFGQPAVRVITTCATEQEADRIAREDMGPPGRRTRQGVCRSEGDTTDDD